MIDSYSQEYNTIHKWVARSFGRATRCEFDKTHKHTRYHWSNKSGSYIRDRNDWQELCPSCHRKFDIKKFGNKNFEGTATHCKRGHERRTNIYVSPSGIRDCSQCKKDRRLEYREKQRKEFSYGR